MYVLKNLEIIVWNILSMITQFADILFKYNKKSFPPVYLHQHLDDMVQLLAKHQICQQYNDNICN